MKDDQVCEIVFDIIDDEQLRGEYPILHSEYAVDRTEQGFISLRWSVWSLDESDEYMFEAISAADHISLENWVLRLTDGQFKEVSRAVNSGVTDNLYELISSLGAPVTDVVVVDLDDAPAAAISSYIERYSSLDIGLEIREWFGDDAVDLSIFPAVIHPMLTASLEKLRLYEAEQDTEQRRKRLQFDLIGPASDIHLKPGAVDTTRISGLGEGLVAVYGIRRGTGSSDILKMRKFAIDIDLLKSEGCSVIDLQGVFAGEQTRGQLCYGVANKTEAEAIKFIGRTEVRVGLFVDLEGNCRVIDLEC